MKKIITSVGMIVFVGALVVGGTGAFFSDTETSTGNVFTAGAIDLTVDSEQHYNGNVCTDTDDGEGVNYQWVGDAEYPTGPCDGTWTATNLGAQKFFNFNDVKPGDEGENTISLHVDSNDAYACVDVTITSNDDVDCTDPENEAEILACENSLPSAEFDGELAQNLEFFAWADDGAIDGFGDEGDLTEGDNIWQDGEIPLFSNLVGPASDVLDGESYTLADSVTGPLEGNTTSYIGLAWCAGDLTVVGPGVLDCDGAQMGNEAQTDEMIADIAFRIEQARNNDDFVCAPEVVVETAALTVDKVVSFSDQQIAGVDVTDFTLTIDGPGDPIVVTDEIEVAGLPAGVYTVSEVYSGNPAGVIFDAQFTGACTDDGTTGTVTLNPSDDVTCTITNVVSVDPNFVPEA